MNNQYKLVILGADWDLYQCAYNDLLTDSVVYKSGFRPKLEPYSTLFRLHNSPKVNAIIPLPFKYVWNRYLLKGVKRDECVVFLIFPIWLAVESNLNLLNYIRSHFRNVKLVLFLQDIVSSMGYLGVNICDYFHNFDLVISYDRRDSIKYGIEYHNTIFSKININFYKEKASDVFFIGTDKGRLSLIVETYIKLTSFGLNCKFILLNVPEEQRILKGEIEYIDHLLSYKETLKYVVGTKCLLEIMQPGAVGITYRTLEAIAYGKKLLTNNKSIVDTGLYSPDYAYIFSTIEGIDKKELGKLFSNPFIGDELKDDIRPKSLVRFIERKLNILIDCK